MLQRRDLLYWAQLLAIMITAGLLWSHVTPHQQIELEDVEYVEVEYEEMERKGFRQRARLGFFDTEKAIWWYNHARRVRKNPAHGVPGCGIQAELIFRLKSGEEITVSSDMRVTRGRPGASPDRLRADYYVQQPGLEQYLHDWDARAEAAGC